MILNHLIETYIILYISVCFHETAHFIAGKIVRLHIKTIHIGDEFFSIHIKKIQVSLLIFPGSYVVFCKDELREKNKLEKVFFFLAGALSNLILVLISSFFRDRNFLYMNILFWINIYL